MFDFVVHHLRWLARVPGLPHLFDALLLTSTCLFHRSRLVAMDALESEALRLPRVRLQIHRFGGIEFAEEDGRELGHLDGHGLLDVAVGTRAAASLIATGKVRPHHIFPHSKWVSFPLRSKADVAFALHLLITARNPPNHPRDCTLQTD